tara:strand:+ start:222 stop:554 length:333 start_codon:yes stop_codon:yes gene_type:complete
MSSGIKETKEVLKFVLSFVQALKTTYEDGEFDWYDAKNFIEPIKNLGDAIDNIDEVLPEITDIDEEEYEELLSWMKEEFPEIIDEEIEFVLDEALVAGKTILTLTGSLSS